VSLTPQEEQIARMVAEGKTNREVGSTLFISPKTVEAHLSRVFRKLEVRSRLELAKRLAARGKVLP
jgi:DNA-binding CsgD family transcriptional regulator